MTGPFTGFDRRVAGALEASPSRIPVIPGGCGTGRTSLLQRLRDRLGRGSAQYIDVERCATTPERFSPRGRLLFAVPMACRRSDARQCARAPSTRSCRFFDTARAPGGAPCHVSAGRGPRAANVRELPRACATCSAICVEALAGKPESLRADDAIRGADAPAAARRHVALRGDAPPAALAGRDRRFARAGVQRVRADADRRSRLPGADGAERDRRAHRVRAGHRRHDGRDGTRRRSDQRSHGAPRPRQRARAVVPVLLRAAAAPRARLRRAQGDPRHPR